MRRPKKFWTICLGSLVTKPLECAIIPLFVVDE
jgi:hypothetical protein